MNNKSPLYMPEATARAAKLQYKSEEELRKMGVGHDAQGFYLLNAVSIPVPKTGMLATVRAVTNVVTSLVNVAEAKLGARASTTMIARREEICRTCFEVDSKGQRLFRFYSVDKVSCGKPMDPTAAGAQVLRDPVADGCGCWLQDKWVGRDQTCPRGRWGAEAPPPIKAQSQSKRRCCGK
jgi:hypothetical protein